MLSLSPERMAIADLVRASPTPVGPKVIAATLNLSYASVRQLVRKLVKQRVLVRVGGQMVHRTD